MPQKHEPIKPFSIQTGANVVLISLHKMIEHLFSLNVIKLSSVRVLCHTHTETSHSYVGILQTLRYNLAINKDPIHIQIKMVRSRYELIGNVG